MRSVIQRQSYGSAKIFWLDSELLESNIRDAARRLALERADVLKVVWFGSTAEGKGVPSSDADILVVVSGTDRRFIDRPLDLVEFFEGVGLGVDLFVYTREEAHSGRIPLIETALKRGRVLFERQSS